MLLEKNLIEYCSPTLASIKTANLFNYSFETEEELKKQLWELNNRLGKKGIFLKLLYKNEKKALIYVYRKSQLQTDLKQPGVGRFLEKYGYEHLEVNYTIERLESRLAQKGTFPHEIGIFLGYPLGDVIGFINNNGKNCKCLGCWKVYCNECEAVKKFARFQKCRAVYAHLWKNGRTVWQLTVAA